MIKKIEHLLVDIWENGLKMDFENHGFMWERHFQAVFYFRLRNVLFSLFGDEIGVWIEPVFNIQKQQVKPDIVITYSSFIVSVIELKFKAWEPVVYEGDITKLNDLIDFKNQAIPLSVKKLKANWNEQKLHGNLRTYTIADNCLPVFAVVGRDGSDALKMTSYQKKDHLKGLLWLIGFIQSGDNEVIFKKLP